MLLRSCDLRLRPLNGLSGQSSAQHDTDHHAPMSDNKVVPFRKRRPDGAADVGREMYERMTRHWHPEIKEMMFPEQFKQEQERRQG